MKKITRRSFLKTGAGSLLSLAGAGLGGRYYAESVEPYLLETNLFKIFHPLIPEGFNGLRIVQFSDTHLGFQFELKDLKAIIDEINKIQPHLIFFTGDLMDAPDQYKNSSEIIPVLSKLKAKGKYSIYGNHDHGGYGTDVYRNIMEGSGFTMLRNEHEKLVLPTSDKIIIAGIDDAMLGKPDIAAALKGTGNEYKIILSHAPDLADEISSYDIHLQLSGHSHGGQVQLPFYGALVTPPFGKKYPEGFYDIRSLKLYVNRGLGTTRLPYRFLSRPEISIFELHNA